MEKNEENFQAQWAKIIAKAWKDQQFKAQLFQDPHGVLKAHGIEVPADKRIVIQENTPDTFYLTFPEKPTGELSDEKLQKIAAGRSILPLS